MSILFLQVGRVCFVPRLFFWQTIKGAFFLKKRCILLRTRGWRGARRKRYELAIIRRPIPQSVICGAAFPRGNEFHACRFFVLFSASLQFRRSQSAPCFLQFFFFLSFFFTGRTLPIQKKRPVCTGYTPLGFFFFFGRLNDSFEVRQTYPALPFFFVWYFDGFSGEKKPPYSFGPCLFFSSHLSRERQRGRENKRMEGDTKKNKKGRRKQEARMWPGRIAIKRSLLSHLLMPVAIPGKTTKKTNEKEPKSEKRSGWRTKWFSRKWRTDGAVSADFWCGRIGVSYQLEFSFFLHSARPVSSISGTKTPRRKRFLVPFTFDSLPIWLYSDFTYEATHVSCSARFA